MMQSYINIITNNDDHIALAQGCQNILDWTDTLCIKQNLNKCKILTVAKVKQKNYLMTTHLLKVTINVLNWSMYQF